MSDITSPLRHSLTISNFSPKMSVHSPCPICVLSPFVSFSAGISLFHFDPLDPSHSQPPLPTYFTVRPISARSIRPIAFHLHITPTHQQYNNRHNNNSPTFLFGRPTHNQDFLRHGRQGKEEVRQWTSRRSSTWSLNCGNSPTAEEKKKFHEGSSSLKRKSMTWRLCQPWTQNLFRTTSWPRMDLHCHSGTIFGFKA